MSSTSCCFFFLEVKSSICGWSEKIDMAQKLLSLLNFYTPKEIRNCCLGTDCFKWSSLCGSLYLSLQSLFLSSSKLETNKQLASFRCIARYNFDI